jgi:single-stranded DNA-binding protein
MHSGIREIHTSWIAEEAATMSILAAFDGRLGAAPQMRTTAKGQPWATFSVAVGRGDETEWVSVSAFGELATELPGERIYCEGRLTVSRWERGGERRATLRVAASRILVLDRIGRRARRRRRSDASVANGAAQAETMQASDKQTAGCC